MTILDYGNMRCSRAVSKHTKLNYTQAWKMCKRLGYSTDSLKNIQDLTKFLQDFQTLTQKNGNPYKYSSLVVRLDNIREMLRINGVADPKLITEKCKCSDGNTDVRCTNHIIHNCIQTLKAKSKSEGSTKLVKLKKLGIVWDDYKKYCIEMQHIVENELKSEIIDTDKLVDAFIPTFIYNLGSPCRLNYTCKIVYEYPSHVKPGESFLLMESITGLPLSLIFNDKMTNILGTCVREIPNHFKPLLSQYIKHIQTNGNNNLFILPNGLPMSNMVFRTRVSLFKYNGTPINMNDLRALYITMRYEDVHTANEIFTRRDEISLEMRQKVISKHVHTINYLIVK